MNPPIAETTWPRILPFYRVVALALTAAATLGLIRLAIWHANPLEQFYLPAYAKLALAKQLPQFPSLRGAKPGDGRETFKMVFCDDFIATPEMLQSDAARLSVRMVRLQPATFDAWLFEHVYHVTLVDFFRPWLVAAGVFFVFCSFWLGRGSTAAATTRPRMGGSSADRA